jgi:hypothetical protein
MSHVEHTIAITRTGKDSGEISFNNITAKCWFEPNNKIEAKLYTDCSLTTMYRKGRAGIYIPNEQTGKNGIFIHYGESAHWSEGCIVTGHEMMTALYAIKRDSMNVSVMVTDANDKQAQIERLESLSLELNAIIAELKK